jgi:hypothetical protein
MWHVSLRRSSEYTLRLRVQGSTLISTDTFESLYFNTLRVFPEPIIEESTGFLMQIVGNFTFRLTTPSNRCAEYM